MAENRSLDNCVEPATVSLGVTDSLTSSQGKHILLKSVQDYLLRVHCHSAIFSEKNIEIILEISKLNSITCKYFGQCYNIYANLRNMWHLHCRNTTLMT